MDTVKIIKTEDEYEQVMAEIDELLDLDPDTGTPEGDRLQLLAMLAGNYEEEHVDLPMPTPVEAIKFRMEQQGLTQRDLIPLLGSRSKVSDVLSGKRPLTLPMIRNLHSHLGIPLEVLVAEPPAPTPVADYLDWGRFPMKEMIKRGWLQAKADLPPFMAAFPAQAVVYRQSANLRSARQMDVYALAAWSARVMNLARQSPPVAPYAPDVVDSEFMRSVAQLSRLDDGVLRAKDYLSRHGIALVIQKHLPHTYLDGAAMALSDKARVIALTLRYDRLDNFWFTLMHELAHLTLHITGETSPFFYDDLDLAHDDLTEQEADEAANEALVPASFWDEHIAGLLQPDKTEVEYLARQLDVHPAIIAGRIRFQTSNYRILNNLVGHGEVRKWFAGDKTGGW